MSDFKAKCTKSISAEAQPQAPLGELTALPRLPSWNKGDLLLRGGVQGRGGGRERKGEKEGRGSDEGEGRRGEKGGKEPHYM